jgi:outer membrane protein assembly factor BamD (BamD/ComL family)
MRRALHAAAMAGLLAAGLTARAQSFIYFKGETEPKAAASVRYKAGSQEYLADMDGVQMTFLASKVERVEVPKPAEFDQAAKLVAGNQPDAAIPILEKIATDYRMLQWDVKAQELLADAYAKKGDNVKAMTLYGELFKNAPAGQVSGEARVRYWNAMMGAQKYEALGAELDRTIAKGTHEEAAMAQLTRGNLRRAQNKTQEALLDYLRAVLMFGDVAAVQPEALYRTAEMMEAVRDPRAAEMRKRLAQEYPNSEFAKKAGGQL